MLRRAQRRPLDLLVDLLRLLGLPGARAARAGHGDGRERTSSRRRAASPRFDARLAEEAAHRAEIEDERGDAAVVVLDYGSGNVRARCGRSSTSAPTSSSPPTGSAALAADGLFVPGRRQLPRLHGRAARGRRARGSSTSGWPAVGPVLGVCVGMQVLFEGSNEPSDAPAGGSGRVARHGLAAAAAGRAAHGLVDVEVPPGPVLFAGIETERFYFVHSYAVHAWTLDEPTGAFAAVAPRVTWADPRRALRRGGRERPAVGHPVPPREVRRGRAGPARELGESL